ncbi:uncharacterized protein [Clytia hemisphaerica]|uniref:Uncharacterized protein n=1 Tax=Clytia hemisphaerica TaxID=252671 RepID=A0A7M5WS05_9CNID
MGRKSRLFKRTTSSTRTLQEFLRNTELSSNILENATGILKQDNGSVEQIKHTNSFPKIGLNDKLHVTEIKDIRTEAADGAKVSIRDSSKEKIGNETIIKSTPERKTKLKADVESKAAEIEHVISCGVAPQQIKDVKVCDGNDVNVAENLSFEIRGEKDVAGTLLHDVVTDGKMKETEQASREEHLVKFASAPWSEIELSTEDVEQEKMNETESSSSQDVNQIESLKQQLQTAEKAREEAIKLLKAEQKRSADAEESHFKVNTKLQRCEKELNIIKNKEKKNLAAMDKQELDLDLKNGQLRRLRASMKSVLEQHEKYKLEAKEKDEELSKVKGKLESTQKYVEVLKKDKQVKNLDEEVKSSNKKKNKRKKKNDPNDPMVNNVSLNLDANNNSSHVINLTCESQANLQLSKKDDVIIMDDINKQVLQEQDAFKQNENILHTQYEVQKDDAESSLQTSNEEWKIDDEKEAAYHACKWFNMILIVVSTIMLLFCFVLHQDQSVFEKITNFEYGTEDLLSAIFLDHS